MTAATYKHTNMRTDIMDMFVDPYTCTLVEMHIDMCIEMCMDIRLDKCTDV